MPPRNPSWQKRPPTTGNDWGFKHVISLKIWQSTGKESVQPSCPRGPAQLVGAIHDFIAKKTINFFDALHSWNLAGRAAAQNFFWNNAFLLIFIDFFGEKIEKIKIFKNCLYYLGAIFYSHNSTWEKSICNKHISSTVSNYPEILTCLSSGEAQSCMFS